MIRILKIEAQNFLSLGNISVDIEDRGLTIIDGINNDSSNFDNNGSGKSSIVEAIVYSLFGKTIRGISDDTLVNREVGKKLEVSIDLEVDGKHYRITRRRKYSSKNNIELWIEGKDATPYSEKELNLEVERILGMSYKVFTSSIVFSDKSIKFAMSTNSELKDIFEDILNLDFLTECYEVAKNRISLSENKIQSLTSKKLDTEASLKSLEEFQNNALEEYRREIEAKNNSICNLKELIEETKTSIECIKDEIKLEEGNLIIQKTKLDELSSQLHQTTPIFTEEFDELKHKNSIDTYRNEIESLEEILNGEKLKATKIKNAISKKKSEKEELEEDINNSPKVGDICKYCGSVITKDTKCEVKENTIRELEVLLQELEEDKKSQQSIIDTYTDKLEKAYENLRKAKKLKKEDYEDFLARKEKFLRDNSDKHIRKLIEEQKEEVNSIEKTIVSKKMELSSLEERYRLKKQELKNLENYEPKNNSELYSDKIKEKKSHLEILSNNMETETKLLEELNFWKVAYGNQGIKSFLLEDIVPYLNNRVNKYLKYLSEGTFIEFTTTKLLKSGNTKDSFTVTIWKEDKPVEYSLFSGGEKKRLDISIILGIQDLIATRNNRNINVAFLDEVFDALDVTGVESIIQVLQELMQERESIFVITHNPELKTFFSNVITVIKDNGVSSIREI